MGPKGSTLFSEDVCPECGSTHIINDPDSGELICSACGLVMKESRVNEGP